MKLISAWDVQEWDGGDRHNHKYFILQSAVTEEELRKRHGQHALFSKADLVVFESFEEVDANSRAALMRSAWGKLTPMERKALGLEEPKP